MIKVIFAGLKYDYGKVKNGFSMEYDSFYMAMKNMAGVEAEFFAIDEHTLRLGRNDANNLLVKTVEEQKPDLVFFFLLADEFEQSTISRVTKLTKTFNWFADDHWRVPVFSRFWAPLFTLVSTTDPNAPALYQKYGITNVIKTQWAANLALYYPQSSQENPGNLDITFVGKKFGKRGGYIEKLLAAGLPAQAFGGGWPGGRVTQKKMTEIFSYSKVNLNFSETHLVGTAAYLKLLSKLFVEKSGGKYKFIGHRLIHNIKSLSGTSHLCIKGRVFEVAACGGFLLTGKTDDDISEYYIPGKEIVIFENTVDLVEKCQYYLEHGPERDKIAKAGYERTTRDHTYEQRFKTIFKALGLNI